MGRPLRYMPGPYAPFAISCRTVQGRFLLRPSKRLNEAVLGVIGRALTRFSVRLHMIVVVSNHMHMILSAPDFVTLSGFMEYVNGNIAKEAGRLHGWKEKFWGDRFAALAIRDDVSLLNHVRYVLSHGCKEGLVGNPAHWPGVNCVKALTRGETLRGVWYDRTREWESRNGKTPREADSFPMPYDVPLTPLPNLEDLDEKDRRRWFRKLVSDIERETRLAATREGRSFLGVKAILNLHPHDLPESPKKSPRPLCLATTRSARLAYRSAYQLFTLAYRTAHENLRHGDLSAIFRFPPDCYLPPLAYQTWMARADPG